MVVECVQSASENGGGCVPAGAPTLKSVEIRVWGFRGRDRFYLGDCNESPIYRGGGLHSCCNGTLGSDGYQIVGIGTAREIIAVTCKETLWFVWTGLACSVHPFCGDGLWVILGLSKWVKVPFDRSRTVFFFSFILFHCLFLKDQFSFSYR